jgi:4-hydroxybenzoate polyprenyltransferase
MKMGIKTKFLTYLRLLRLQAGALIATLALLGAVVIGQNDPKLLIIIFIIGILYHIYTYVLNEYMDLNVDKQSKDLKRKPLVSGAISEQSALIISISAAIGAYIITLIFFPYTYAIVFLSFAILLGGIYDWRGKKMPGFSDFIIAGSLAFSFFFGASTIPVSIDMVTILIGLLFFFFVVYANAVEGGLKDVDHDYLGGAKTLALIMGVKVQEGRLFITKKFAAFSFGIEIISFAIILLLAFQPEINLFDSSEYWKLITVILLIIISLISTIRLNTLKKFDRPLMKKLFGIINSSSGAMIIIMIFPIIGFELMVVLLLLPITWYIVFNIILYGKPFQPDI